MGILRRNILKRVMGASLALFTMGATSSAMANHGEVNFNRLYDGLEELSKGAQAVRRGQPFRARIQLQRAYYKLKIAEISLRRQYRSGSAIEAVQLALEKMSPYSGLSLDEKLRWGIDCASVALVQLGSDELHGREGALKLMQVGKLLVNIFYFDQAAQALEAAQDKLYGHGVNAAIEALHIAVQKITDPYLSAREKLVWGNDCIGEAENALRYGSWPRGGRSFG